MKLVEVPVILIKIILGALAMGALVIIANILS